MPVFSVQIADAEAGIERVDERDRRAVAVDHREIDRVAAGRRRARQRHALCSVDAARRAFLANALSSSIGDRHAHVRRLGDVGVAHRKAQARGLQHQMEAVGAERIERGEIEILQDVEHHQRGEPLPVRRNFDQVEAAIVGRDRRHRLAAMAREIFRGQHRARAPRASPPCRRRSRLRRTRAGRFAAMVFNVAASAGSLMTSPSAGARPSNR